MKTLTLGEAAAFLHMHPEEVRQRAVAHRLETGFVLAAQPGLDLLGIHGEGRVGHLAQGHHVVVAQIRGLNTDATARDTVARALDYMGLAAGTRIRDIAVDTVFIGSCTNSRIEDLRAAADVAKGRKVKVKRAMVVPGSHAVKQQAEREGLDRVFIDAGFDWREPGCSMCLAMNPDKLAPQERAASTSNRNFEGRQGRGGRTHLVSPAVAAATALTGRFATPQDLS